MLKELLSKITYAIWKVVEFMIDLMLPTDCPKCYFMRVVMFVLGGMFLGVMYGMQIQSVIADAGIYTA